MTTPDDRRPLLLPVHGAVALSTVLGILDDVGALVDPDLVELTESQLRSPWTPDEWQSLGDGTDRTVELSIAEAALLLHGLRLTESLSTELPFYGAVIDTVVFIGDHLVGLYSDDEWLAFQDRGLPPGFA